MRITTRRPSPALVVSLVALFVALGGTGYAAVQINGKHIKNGTVTGKKLKNRTIGAAKIRRNALTGAQIAEHRLGTVPRARQAQSAAIADRAAAAAEAGRAQRATTADRALAADTAGTAARLEGRIIAVETAEPTVAADPPAARAAAPELTLFEVGPLTVYGRCWASGGGIWAAAYVKTAADGAILSSEAGSFLFGHPYLDVATAEDDRELFEVSTGGNAAFSSPPDTTAFYAVAPDGTQIRGDVYIGVKVGSPPAGDGPYGPGSSCRFSGVVDRIG